MSILRDGEKNPLPAIVRAPDGRPIARVVQEGQDLVLLRQVTEKHRYRAADAWPLGAYAVEQARQLGVTLLRYSAPAGIYLIGFGTFLARAIRLPFPHETQFVVPRRFWQFVSSGSEQTPLGF